MTLRYQDAHPDVVAAQVYGKMKKSQDGKAGDIEWLLHRWASWVRYDFATVTFKVTLLSALPMRGEKRRKRGMPHDMPSTRTSRAIVRLARARQLCSGWASGGRVRRSAHQPCRG